MITEIIFTPVQEDILRVEELMRSQTSDAHRDLQAALEHLLSSGGKRIRPTLGLLIGNMLAGDHERLIKLAAAVELLHTATLVHDDLIDGALLRRGMPTINSRWTPPATVLTGDFLFARAAKLAAETDCLALMRLFAQTLATIVNGEIAQLFSTQTEIQRESYYQRIYAKTASLFEMTARAAAMVSPVEDATIEAIADFGYQIGMAFQIVDDILDFKGEQAVVGKPVGSDLLQGLITLPTICYAEEHQDDPNLQLLINGEYQEREKMLVLVDAIRQSNATQKSLTEAKKFVDQARGIIANFQPGVEREALEGLATYIIDRKI